MHLSKIDFPITSSSLLWYQAFASDVLELDFNIDKASTSVRIHAGTLELEGVVSGDGARLKFQLQLPSDLKLDEFEKKMELFVYKYRANPALNQGMFFRTTVEGVDWVVVRDPNGHEWFFGV